MPPRQDGSYGPGANGVPTSNGVVGTNNHPAIGNLLNSSAPNAAANGEAQQQEQSPVTGNGSSLKRPHSPTSPGPGPNRSPRLDTQQQQQQQQRTPPYLYSRVGNS